MSCLLGCIFRKKMKPSGQVDSPVNRLARATCPTSISLAAVEDKDTVNKSTPKISKWKKFRSKRNQVKPSGQVDSPHQCLARPTCPTSLFLAASEVKESGTVDRSNFWSPQIPSTITRNFRICLPRAPVRSPCYHSRDLGDQTCVTWKGLDGQIRRLMLEGYDAKRSAEILNDQVENSYDTKILLDKIYEQHAGTVWRNKMYKRIGAQTHIKETTMFFKQTFDVNGHQDLLELRLHETSKEQDLLELGLHETSKETKCAS